MLRHALAVATLTGTLVSVAWAQAQEMPRVAIVFNSPPLEALTTSPPLHDAARAIVEGLKDFGWVDGRNVKLVWRSAEQHPDRFPAIMDELVRIPVDVIVVSGNVMAKAALAKTRSIPIVMGSSSLAVEDGLIESYSRPGGNVTGVATAVGEHLSGKRIALLKQLAPRVSRVAFVSPSSVREFLPATTETLKSLGLTGLIVHANLRHDYERALSEAVRQGANGMVVVAAPPAYVRENQVAIHELATRHQLPVVHGVLTAAASGGLAAYATDEIAIYRRVGSYVDRILRGAAPGSLPIEQPHTFFLHVNRKAAKAIGLSIPQSVLVQADRVIE